MSKPRKLWSVRFCQVPGDKRQRFESKADVYRYVDAARANWACNALRSRHLSVFVDERDGQGWRLHERIDLSEPV